jgi:hypothetical protein
VDDGPIGVDDANIGMSRRVRRSAVVGAAGGSVDTDVERRIQAARGGGRPMSTSDRSMMEGALGTDLGEVRVHTGTEAADLNDVVQARAFTIGNDVFFRDGVPNTDSPAGQHLLAHELAHTMQRGDGVNRMIRREYVSCGAKDAANASDFFEVDDPKAKGKKRKVYWKRQAKARDGYEFVKATDQPGMLTWGLTYLYDEVETAQHREDRQAAERKRVDAAKAEKLRVESEQRQAKEQEGERRRQEEVARDETRRKMGWFGAYKSEVEEAHSRNPSAASAKLSDDVVNAIEGSLSRIPAVESELGKVWKRCMGTKMGSACPTTSGAELLNGRPEPDGRHGAPAVDIAKRVGSYLDGLRRHIGEVEKFISTWCTPLDVDADLLIATHGTATAARAFILSMGGVESYRALRARTVTPDAMLHYGADWLKNFRGVTAGTMDHLTKATINSQGDISGGHDAAAFDQFIVDHPTYSVTNTQRIAPGVEKRTWSRAGGGSGTKTVIEDLAADAALWKATLTDAVWASIAAKTFPNVATGAITDFPGRINGLKYRFFFDGTELDTFFPVGT